MPRSDTFYSVESRVLIVASESYLGTMNPVRRRPGARMVLKRAETRATCMSSPLYRLPDTSG